MTLEHRLSEYSSIVATKDQVSCDLAQESVILDLKSGVYYGLNEVGNWIWNLIQEPRTLNEIRDALVKEYEVEPDCCERELKALLEKLADSGLISIRNATAA